MTILFFVLIVLVAAIAFALLLKSRNMHLWIVPYITRSLSNKPSPKYQNVYVCLADHYEPYFGNADQEKARGLVDTWVKKYREIASQHTDSFGSHPKHSYFYPIEEYDEYVMSKLKDICDEGLGDVDIHLHHDNDNEANLTKTLIDFKELLFNKHGLLRKDENGEIVYGFIHGNWALDNSRPDGRWCGIDNEIDILLDTGCVYDMTMPSAPSDTQTSTINSIYFAKEDGKAKSHDKGVMLTKDNWTDEDLLMIQGPLELNWKSRKLGLIPRIEAGELSLDAPPNETRIDLWKKSNITIEGMGEHVFIKIYTHGLQEKNMKMFFDNNGFDTLWSTLEEKFKNSEGYSLHYVSAWEMYCKIKELATD
jgi:hypothetical protein